MTLYRQSINISLVLIVVIIEYFGIVFLDLVHLLHKLVFYISSGAGIVEAATTNTFVEPLFDLLLLFLLLFIIRLLVKYFPKVGSG